MSVLDMDVFVIFAYNVKPCMQVLVVIIPCHMLIVCYGVDPVTCMLQLVSGDVVQ